MLCRVVSTYLTQNTRVVEPKTPSSARFDLHKEVIHHIVVVLARPVRHVARREDDDSRTGALHVATISTGVHVPAVGDDLKLKNVRQ